MRHFYGGEELGFCSHLCLGWDPGSTTSQATLRCFLRCHIATVFVPHCRTVVKIKLDDTHKALRKVSKPWRGLSKCQHSLFAVNTPNA